MRNYEIKQAFKNLPNVGVPDNEQVACREYEQCDGCLNRRMVLFAGTETANA